MQPVSNQAKHVTQGVISYLKKQKQLHLLPQVAKETFKASRAHLDPNIAHVISAVPVPDNSQAEIKTNLEKLFNRSLTLDYTVDNTLIGGLVIKVGDQVIDQSLSYQINQLKTQVKL